MNQILKLQLKEHIKVMESIDSIKDNIEILYKMIDLSIKNKGKIMICGNGGSAADAQHFAAELVVKFEKKRSALPAIALSTDTSILTAAGNDFSFNDIFSRQIEALASKNDLVIGISTSGKSQNILEALRMANAKGAKTVILSGKSKVDLDFINHKININSIKTSRIQEAHLFIYHVICSMLDEKFR